jgi:hypothetical protein
MVAKSSRSDVSKDEKINVPALQIKEFLDIFLCFAKNEQQLTYCKARHFLRQKVTVTRICTFIDPSASNL